MGESHIYIRIQDYKTNLWGEFSDIFKIKMMIRTDHRKRAGECKHRYRSNDPRFEGTRYDGSAFVTYKN